RQEQRFHLELGVLKMVHAQRILPLEQILSQVSGESQPQKTGDAQRTPASRPAPVSAGSPAFAAPAAKQQPVVSPFEADRARKRSFDSEMSVATAPAVQAQPVTVIQTQVVQTQAVATAVAVIDPESEPEPEPAPEPSGDAGVILGHVVAAIENLPGGDNLAATLAEGSAVIQGNELIVTVPRPASVIPFIINPEQKQVANAAASAAAGRTLKVTLVGGAKSATNGPAPAIVRPRNGNGNGASARSRASDDPIVQRMREKFGAEIRTVIDHRDKN
ncbi:MAG TPA: hypothetical protein VHA06_08870, partial [Candidatus Angelobacter sp.]|nr:hypothetical protein [Candidatus Angelobacter sp.]